MSYSTGDRTPAEQQWGPYPEALEELVKRLRYRPDWEFDLADIVRDQDHETGEKLAGGLTFVVTTKGYNSYHPERGRYYRVHHYFPVPAATYNEQSWIRWLFESLVKVETHEAMEFFRFVTKGEYDETSQDHDEDIIERPYAPNHGPGNDPYIVRELTTEEDRRTSFRGSVNP